MKYICICIYHSNNLEDFQRRLQVSVLLHYLGVIGIAQLIFGGFKDEIYKMVCKTYPTNMSSAELQ